MNKSEEGIEVVVVDSAGDKKPFLDAVCKFIRSQLPQATIWGFKLPRQAEMRSCLMLALNDARVIAAYPDAFIASVRSQGCIPSRRRFLHVF